MPHLASSPRSGPQLHRDDTETESRRDKRDEKRRKTKNRQKQVLKVKFPKFTHALLGKKTPTRWMLEAAANETKNPAGQEKETQGRFNCADTPPAPVDEDVFFFSQRSDIQTTDEKEKAKISVLGTISRMLEENRLIRQRLATLSQAN